MINILLAILTFVVGSCGYEAQPLEHITIYNAPHQFNIDNIDKVVYLYPFGYIVTFEFHPDTFILVWDYYDYWAVSISERGIEPVDF